MSHFFSVSERALLRAFGKSERDVLIRYGKSLVGKRKEEVRNDKTQDRQGSEAETEK